MNKIQKMIMSFAAVALIVGSSAFTAKNKRAVIRYYKVDAINYPNASDPNGYQYFSGDRCENGGSLCSMEWDLGSNPSPTADGTPLPTTGVTQQSDTLEPGHFE